MGCGGSKSTEVVVEPKKDVPQLEKPKGLSEHNLGGSWAGESGDQLAFGHEPADRKGSVVHGISYKPAEPEPEPEKKASIAAPAPAPAAAVPKKSAPAPAAAAPKKPSVMKQLSSALSPRSFKKEAAPEPAPAVAPTVDKAAERAVSSAITDEAITRALEIHEAFNLVVAYEVAENAIEDAIRIYQEQAAEPPSALSKMLTSVGRSVRNLFKPAEEHEPEEPAPAPPPPRAPSTNEPPPRIAAKIAFKAMDHNGDGKLSRDEIILSCKSDNKIRSLLNLPQVISKDDG